MKLYEINQQLISVIEGADENGEINIELFDQLSLEKSEKQLNVIKYIKHCELQEEFIDEEINRLKNLKMRVAKKTAWLVKYLGDSMRLDGVNELDFVNLKAKFKKNPAKVEIINEGLIPNTYLNEKIVTTVNKELIKVDLKAGIEVPGCELIQEERLTIS